jgi:hypothetical protein
MLDMPGEVDAVDEVHRKIGLPGDLPRVEQADNVRMA